MFCSKCGKEINNETVICPHCGCTTTKFSNPMSTQVSIYSNDYLSIHEFLVKATNIRNLGIAAAILMLFGIGIIFSIIIWVKAPKVKEPVVNTTNQNELAELEDAKRKLRLGQRLANLPMMVIGLSIVIACIWASIWTTI